MQRFRTSPVSYTHLVALEPGKTCGHCKFCREGKYNLCPDVVFFATPPVDGVFQEYVACLLYTSFHIFEVIEQVGIAAIQRYTEQELTRQCNQVGLVLKRDVYKRQPQNYLCAARKIPHLLCGGRSPTYWPAEQQMLWFSCRLSWSRANRPTASEPPSDVYKRQGEGFGFFVFFGKQNESIASPEK